MILEPGTKLHVITRRAFAEDTQGHFVGEVMRATDSTAMLKGYAFVPGTSPNEFVRKPDRRTRVISLADAANVINVIPLDVDLESLTYRYSKAQRLLVTDGESFEMDIHEFGGGG